MVKLYLIPLPIAENESLASSETTFFVSPEIRESIEQTSVFLVENLRTARRYIRRVCREKEIDTLHFFQLDKNTSYQDVEQFFKILFEKNPQVSQIGVMSEAGVPCIADPGNLAVRYAHAQNWLVMPLIGASSLLLGLMASGLNGQKFAFQGYLPIESEARKKELQRLESESKKQNQTQLFIETPYRNEAIFEELLKTLQPKTDLCIAADLTSKNAYIKTQTIKQWRTAAESKPNLHKRPTLFLFLAH
ncbi:SAM-dependent methyltransferase [Hugenholtzia roseola]|uniref:SAM-dependent methyltransferase n=1 Tax=Hugenholtzia roseola TaxID=1002 RepID=UPI000408D8D1|nr:SAM-dependent methyltransferase [Hugenholtzia roseola]